MSSRSMCEIADASRMARLLWVPIVALWLFAMLRVVRAHRRTRPDRRLMVALETLREWHEPARPA